MPKYLVRLTAEGEPVGVHSPRRSHYDGAHEAWKRSGDKVLELRSESVTWDDFAEHVVTSVSDQHRWDTFTSASRSLPAVLSEVKKQTERSGYADDE